MCQKLRLSIDINVIGDYASLSIMRSKGQDQLKCGRKGAGVVYTTALRRFLSILCFIMYMDLVSEI